MQLHFIQQRKLLAKVDKRKLQTTLHSQLAKALTLANRSQEKLLKITPRQVLLLSANLPSQHLAPSTLLEDR